LHRTAGCRGGGGGRYRVAALLRVALLRRRSLCRGRPVRARPGWQRRGRRCALGTRQRHRHHGDRRRRRLLRHDGRLRRAGRHPGGYQGPRFHGPGSLVRYERNAPAWIDHRDAGGRGRMKTLKRNAIVAGAILGLLVACAEDEPERHDNQMQVLPTTTRGSVVGRVETYEMQPIEGAEVEIATGTRVRTVKTDAEGRFVIPDLPGGSELEV